MTLCIARRDPPLIEIGMREIVKAETPAPKPMAMPRDEMCPRAEVFAVDLGAGDVGGAGRSTISRLPLPIPSNNACSSSSALSSRTSSSRRAASSGNIAFKQTYESLMQTEETTTTADAA